MASFGVALLLAASPMLVHGTGSSSGFLVMQGATEPFRVFLGLREAPYTMGQAYSDELTLSGIGAEELGRHRGIGTLAKASPAMA